MEVESHISYFWKVWKERWESLWKPGFSLSFLLGRGSYHSPWCDMMVGHNNWSFLSKIMDVCLFLLSVSVSTDMCPVFRLSLYCVLPGHHSLQEKLWVSDWYVLYVSGVNQLSHWEMEGLIKFCYSEVHGLTAWMDPLLHSISINQILV